MKQIFLKKTRFKVDENLPGQVAKFLLRRGYDAMTVADQQMIGASDDNLANVCIREQRALITLDLDFANIHTYPPKDYPGLIVLRLRTQDLRHVLNTISRLSFLFANEPLAGRLWIVDEQRVRIRQ